MLRFDFGLSRRNHNLGRRLIDPRGLDLCRPGSFADQGILELNRVGREVKLLKLRVEMVQSDAVLATEISGYRAGYFGSSSMQLMLIQCI